MKHKNIYLLLILLLLFVPVFVSAADTQKSEKTCNEQGVQNCGRLRMCSIKTDSSGNKYCGLNDYSKQSFECSSTSNEEDCNKCSGYIWNRNTNSCVATKSVSSKITKVSCGQLTDIPKKIPDLTTMIVRILWVIVPIILVIFGSIDLAKGVVAGKEKKIKKGQKIFIKRLITGIIIFLIIALTKFVVGIVSEDNSESISSCIDCFINGKCGADYVE